MKILAIDSSACSASVAVTQDYKILSECCINAGLTHSQTLMPMVDFAVKNAGLKISDIDLFAASSGPGSFTGVRIGIAALKGIADAVGGVCAGVSTLEAMAYNAVGTDCTAVCCMDARCKQIYTAAFDIEKENIKRLTNDEAIAIEDMRQRLNTYKKPVILLGDGAELVYGQLKDSVDDMRLSSHNMRFQRAVGVAFAAQSGNYKRQSAAELVPSYLRLSQAERELRKKENEK